MRALDYARAIVGMRLPVRWRRRRRV